MLKVIPVESESVHVGQDDLAIHLEGLEVEVVDESVASNAPRDARGGNVWLALAVAIPLAALGGWLFTHLDPTVPRPESEHSHSD